MTSRSKNAVRIYETEIEKSREESNWKKAVELAQQLKARSPQHESLAHFLIGEGKLEAHLDEWPPLKENIERAQRELSEARGYLTLATDEAGIKAGVALDAHLLLGKLNYACGSYDEALKHYKQAELNTLTEKELPVRSLRIVAESYAIKGLCLEQNAVPSSTSRYKQAERENETLRSFELSSELTLLYLQRVGAGGRAGPTLETALYRVPIAHIRAQRLHSALDRYRSMLSAVEAPGTAALRLTLARQLAEVLMRGVTGQVYRPPAAAAAPRRREDPAPEGPWKPKKYTAINQFVPRTSYEEVVLVLLVGEAMAVRDAVLSQSAEFEAARAHSLANAVAVIDLLAVVATRWGQLCLVLESLERAMKFSFGSRHVWRQRALATAAAAPAQHHHEHVKPGTAQWSTGVRALGVLRHAAPLAPADAPLRLVGANTCYRCGWIEEGIELAEAALAIEEESEGFMLARCHLFTGLGYQMKAQKTNSRIDKDAANDVALKHLMKSVQLDDNDHLAFYYLALQHMHLGMLNEAMEATRACLAARASCAGGLRVCAALWSCACAGPRAERALRAAALARAHYPRAAWPLAALAALQAARGAAEAALATGKELLSLLNSTELEAETEYNGYVELDALSDSQHDDTHSTRDAASIRAESAGAYRLELALSEGASSLSAARPLAAPRAQAWLLLAAACLRYRRLPQARPSERGGGVRFGSGGSDALQPPGALYARHGARGRPGVGGSARVLPERARHPPDAPRQPGAAGRRLLRARLAGAGGAQPARRRGAGARARRRLAPPGAGAGRARGRRRRRRRRGRRPAPAALAARRRAAAVSPAPASCRHPPPCTCSPRSPPPRCRCEPGARLLPTPAALHLQPSQPAAALPL